MIVLRLVQAALALALAVAAAFIPGHTPTFAFGLGVVGETEQPDGSWQGADLLAHPGAASERFQLLVRPTATVRFSLDELTPCGPRRIYPAQGQSGVLHADRSYALPGPRQFYERNGATRLRLTVTSEEAAGAGTPGSWGTTARTLARLSDGARLSVTERLISAGDPGYVEFALP